MSEGTSFGQSMFCMLRVRVILKAHNLQGPSLLKQFFHHVFSLKHEIDFNIMLLKTQDVENCMTIGSVEV